jgi:xanthine dehydrogenase accessory factor
MGQVGDTTVTAPLTGMVRGLLQDGLQVTTRFKIGDIDPRGAKADHLSASDKALAIGGGVLEAMLRLQNKALASSVQLT